MADPITIREIEEIAKSSLPASVYNYYACGADEENALRRNIEAFDRHDLFYSPRTLPLTRYRLFILPRVLIDVSSVDTSTNIFGTRCSLPIGIAPSAMQKLVGGDGELDMARAATNLGLNLTLSSQSTTSLEEVMRVKHADSPPFWHQLYITTDLEMSIPLIRRAEGEF